MREENLQQRKIVDDEKRREEKNLSVRNIRFKNGNIQTNVYGVSDDMPCCGDTRFGQIKFVESGRCCAARLQVATNFS